MKHRITLFCLCAVLALLLTSCSAKIHGTVQLLDENMELVVGESPEGSVVNMINTTAKVEEASHSIMVDEEGKFESEADTITPGTYKVEATRIGYVTETQSVEMGGSTNKKLDFQLKRIPEAKRKTIAGASSDADKIINPGEVNIRPPGM